MAYQVTVHVHADGAMSLDDAHALGGRVKHAICEASPHVNYVVVHMEPRDGASAETGERGARSAGRSLPDHR